MAKSVLQSVKHNLGIDKDCEAFDADIMLHVNAALSTLYQIGVDSARNKIVDGANVTWLDIFEDDEGLLPMIEQYVYLKVRVVFDPPSNSFVLESINKMIDELQWRIQIEAEGGFEDLPQKSTKKSSKRSYEEDC